MSKRIGRPPKYTGGTRWIRFAMPEQVAREIEAVRPLDVALEAKAVGALMKRYPEASWQKEGDRSPGPG